jgi:hypothetical protein
MNSALCNRNPRLAVSHRTTPHSARPNHRHIFNPPHSILPTPPYRMALDATTAQGPPATLAALFDLGAVLDALGAFSMDRQPPPPLLPCPVGRGV